MRNCIPLFFLFGCAGSVAVESSESSAVADVPVADVFFDANWQIRQSAGLYAGKPAVLHYDVARLPSCRATYNGLPAWAISAFWSGDARWTNSAAISTGGPAQDIRFIVPAGKDLAMWFENSDEHGCTGWDSNYGKNFHFLITTLASPTIHFQRDWSVWNDNPILAGQPVLIDYEVQRLPSCRSTYNGNPAWDITAWVRFDGGAATGASVIQTVQNQRLQAPIYVDVPAGAKSMELWFENTDVEGCHAWDSNYSRNFKFSVN
jgi:uncharacterized protein YraI